MLADRRAKRDAFLAKIGRRPVVMGILNLTPDSFSDGGRFLAAEAALSHAREMAAAGCDIVDVGGESTRPGAVPVGEADEIARIEPVLTRLAETLDVAISIDTYKSGVARRTLELGAVVINDVWGLQKDPAIARSHVILDPGIAFAKTARQNIEVIARLRELTDFGCPILVGCSRKKFFGSLVEGGTEAELIGTVAANLAAYAAGAAIFRVHDVAEHVAALKVFHAIRPPTS